MPKIMVAPNKFTDIDRIIEGADAIVVGIENLSVNFLEIKVSDIPQLTEKVHSKSKKIFISINKNMILPPSKAGKGRRLNTPKFIVIKVKRYNSESTPLLVASPTAPAMPTGPDTASAP